MELFLLNNWPDRDKVILLKGLSFVRAALWRVTGSDEAYNHIYGPVKFSLSTSLAYWGYTEGDTMKFQPGLFVVPTVLHECGHRFAIAMHPGPEEVLSCGSIISPDGTFITGINPASGFYKRHNFKRSPENGYVSDSWLQGYQVHPLNMVENDTAANSWVEDWPDIFRCWVRSEFAANMAGETLYNWAEDHIRQWLADYRLKPETGNLSETRIAE